jgi:putative ABC transport system permease protein
VSRSLMITLGITNALAALSGGLLALHQGFADIGLGQGILIVGLASLTVGERLIPETKLPLVAYVLAASVVGGVVYQLLVAFAIRLGLNPIDLKLVTALFVLMLVAMRVRDQHDSSLQ